MWNHHHYKHAVGCSTRERCLAGLQRKLKPTTVLRRLPTMADLLTQLIQGQLKAGEDLGIYAA